MPILVYGNYLLSVTHSVVGHAKNEILMVNVVKITSISPTTGSMHGTRITITGNGFPSTGIVINYGDSL